MLIRWHWPPENSMGRRPPASLGLMPTDSRVGAGLGPAFVAGPDAPDGQGLHDRVENTPTRIQRGDGVLEDHLDLGPRLAQLARTEGGELGAGEADRSGVGRMDEGDGPSRGGLSTSRFAHQAQGLAGGHVEAHVGDGLDPTLALAELHDQVLGPQEHVLVAAQLGRPAAGHQASLPSGPRRRSAASAGAPAGLDGDRPRPGTVPVKARAAGTPAATLRARASSPSGDPTGNQQREEVAGPGRAGRGVSRPGSGPGRRGSGGRRDSPGAGRPGRGAGRGWPAAGCGWRRSAGGSIAGGPRCRASGCGRRGPWWGPARRCVRRT